MEDRSACSNCQEQLGLRFTIDYLLYNKGHKTEREGSKESSSTAVVPHTTVDDQVNEVLPEEQSGRLVDQEHGQGRSDKQKGQPENEKTGVTRKESKEQKPTESYITLISMAILASVEKKLLLADIYKWIMDHYPYFKSKDKNWRNSVRHNLSLNECFIKAGRSDSGKGHFWAIHPANFHDFSNGDYRRRQPRRRVRRVTGRLPYNLDVPYQSFNRVKEMPCWYCPVPQFLPCFTTRAHWGWTSLQASQTPSLNGLL
ncbi:forkhead box Q2 [Salminus brasiliensis]|uniref:forkhead box Q2 n=1 Tax=Salminus brasiliensis TaxID=930266 RepID=UPI003B834F2F